jgi:hypothetical protein
MQLTIASFAFKSNGDSYRVSFEGEMIHVIKSGDIIVDYNNERKEWRPCPTHALRLIDMTFFRKQKPRGPQEEKRHRNTRPTLKVVKS